MYFFFHSIKVKFNKAASDDLIVNLRDLPNFEDNNGQVTYSVSKDVATALVLPMLSS